MAVDSHTATAYVVEPCRHPHGIALSSRSTVVPISASAAKGVAQTTRVLLRVDPPRGELASRGHGEPRHADCRAIGRSRRGEQWLGGRRPTGVWSAAANCKRSVRRGGEPRFPKLRAGGADEIWPQRKRPEGERCPHRRRQRRLKRTAFGPNIRNSTDVAGGPRSSNRAAQGGQRTELYGRCIRCSGGRGAGKAAAVTASAGRRCAHRAKSRASRSSLADSSTGGITA